MKNLILSITLSIGLISTSANADSCFGGPVEDFLEVEFTDDQGVFCSRLCFTKDHWKSGDGPTTLARFLFAANNGSMNLGRVQQELDSNFRVRSPFEIGNVLVHAYSCAWRSGTKHCTNNVSKLCAR